MALTRFTIEVGSNEGTVHIEGEGVVTITGAPGPNDVEAIVAFLQAVDVETVEREAMQRLGWGDKSALAMAIEIMVEALTGKPASA